MGLLLLSLSFIFVYTFAYRVYLYLRYTLPPGPFPLPIIGNLNKIKPDMALCFENWSKTTYGPIMSIWFGSKLGVVVSSSELAREVLRDKDEMLANRYRNKPVEAVTHKGKDLIWADYGSHFVKVKKVCVHEVFSPASVEALRPIREDEVKDMVESIYRDNCTTQDNHDKCLLLRKYVSMVAFNTITRFALGKRFFSGQEGAMTEKGLEFKDVFDGQVDGSPLALIEYIWLLSWLCGFFKKGISKHLARQSEFIRAIIGEHKEIGNDSNNGAKQHFVNVLLSLQERQDISEQTMVGLVWDMVTAGKDTVAITVEWAMAQLVKNQRVQRKVHEEIDRVIGPNRPMTEMDIMNLPYLQCVTKETLRLHPPTPLLLPHKASSHVKVGGFDIPKGTGVFVNVSAIGHDPMVWDNPLEFRPERFLEEDVDIKGHDFRLLPFGAGRRMCPASQLSLNLVTSMIGHLLHNFEWSLPEGVDPNDLDMSGTPGLVRYMKTPLQVVPTVRPPSHLHWSS